MHSGVGATLGLAVEVVLQRAPFRGTRAAAA